MSTQGDVCLGGVCLGECLHRGVFAQGRVSALGVSAQEDFFLGGVHPPDSEADTPP